MIKIVLFSCIFTSLFADVQLIPMSKKSIGFKEIITRDDIYLVEATKKNRCKSYLDTNGIIEHKYRAKHYILQNRKICARDVYKVKHNKIKFNFGLVEIERDGELIKETNKYIKFRNIDGKIEKIYKNGDKI